MRQCPYCDIQASETRCFVCHRPTFAVRLPWLSEDAARTGGVRLAPGWLVDQIMQTTADTRIMATLDEPIRILIAGG